MKAEYRGAQGQFTLFFGNKAKSALQRLICIVPPAPAFSFQMGPVPPSLDPGKQVQVRLPPVPLSLSRSLSFSPYTFQRR